MPLQLIKENMGCTQVLHERRLYARTADDVHRPRVRPHQSAIGQR